MTGATGAVGPSVVRACQAAGYSVRTLSIDAAERGVLLSGVDVRVGDVCDSQAVRSAVAGVEVVVHLAALLHQFGDATGLGPQYERVNVGGTENVVRAAIAQGVRRVVFLSTIAVYGPTSGQLIDENTPPRPDTLYGQTKLAAEQAVLSATRGGEPIGTVLRAAAAYGSRVKGNYRRLALAIARRRFVPLGPCANRRTVVHDRDLASAAVLAAGPSRRGWRGLQRVRWPRSYPRGHYRRHLHGGRSPSPAVPRAPARRASRGSCLRKHDEDGRLAPADYQGGCWRSTTEDIAVDAH